MLLKMFEAIEQGDALTALEACFTLRQMRSDGELVPELADEMYEDLRWTGDVYPNKSPGDALLFIHKLLPDAWNFREDIIVLAGTDLGGVEMMLRAVGQRNIVNYTSLDELYAQVRACTKIHIACRCAVVSTDSNFPVDPANEVIYKALGDAMILGNTTKAFADRWYTQALRHLPIAAQLPTIASLHQVGRNRPFIFIAPGPSLRKNIHILKEIHDASTAILCACSHALDYLTEQEITPDIVVTVDPSGLGYHYDQTDMSKIPVMISGVTCYNGIYEHPVGQHYTCGVNDSLDNWFFSILEMPGSVPSGGSVSTVMFSIARIMECSPIVAVGLDLSFPDGEFYAGGRDGGLHVGIDEHGQYTTEGASQEAHDLDKPACVGPLDGQAAQTLAGYYGGEVYTSTVFKQYHNWFMRAANNNEATYINATEGGAYIPNFRHMPLEGVVEEYLDKPFDKPWPAVIPSKETVLRNIDKLLEQLDNGEWPHVLNLWSQYELAKLYEVRETATLEDLEKVRRLRLDKIKELLEDAKVQIVDND